jgi:hypothetical protein
MNKVVFLYNLNKMKEMLLSVMKMWSARTRVPAVQILTVQTIFYGLFDCCC